MDIQACFRCSRFVRIPKSLSIWIFKRVFDVQCLPESPKFTLSSYKLHCTGRFWRKYFHLCGFVSIFKGLFFGTPKIQFAFEMLIGHFFFYMGTFDLQYGHFCPLPRVSLGFGRDIPSATPFIY